jgi:acyl transferase domain-containing protein
MDNIKDNGYMNDVAIIGMVGRFPGANSVEQFWNHLKEGIESIAHFPDQNGEPEEDISQETKHGRFIKVNTAIEGAEYFDASFFGISVWEAEIMDPQHRLFLECAWEALENAGYDPQKYSGLIGLYAGVYANYYLLKNVYPACRHMNPAREIQVTIGNEKDHLTTYTAYKLNLNGPVMTVQTACSSSLAAIHLGCESLLTYSSDLVLAGGVTIASLEQGYYYIEGGLLSSDGHCRVFDADASGTLYSNGLGIVVLKRLADALNDGDMIYAVIKGSAVNNDGAARAGYTAPGVKGQAEVIARALAIAEVDPTTITYIEAHGTGTPLGDGIELEALNQVFSSWTTKRGICAIGSVKSNIGHSGPSAGVSGLIKTTLSLKHKMIPPSLNFENPNPKLDFSRSPFYVNTVLSEWHTNGIPRRAGVSSFGLGGTNVHVIMEEAPQVQSSGKSRAWKLLVLSAKTDTALTKMTENTIDYLQQHPDINLADMAYTLQVGRREFEYRRILPAKNTNDALQALKSMGPGVITRHQEYVDRPVVFLFPGEGESAKELIHELYQQEPTFRRHLEDCIEQLNLHMNISLKDILTPGITEKKESTQFSIQHSFTEPVLFAIEYALAHLWLEWGIHPEGMVGIGIGEYAAASIAGVFSLEDAIKLVSLRSRLTPGSMVKVKANPQNTGYQRTLNPPADEVLHQIALTVKEIRFNPQSIPFLSHITGTWITSEEAVDPGYWQAQMQNLPSFPGGIIELLKESNRIFLEIGPGNSASSQLRLRSEHKDEPLILSSLTNIDQTPTEIKNPVKTLGLLWLAGVNIEWRGYYVHERRNRIPLPTYPFERRRFWIEPQESVEETENEKPESSLTYVQLEKSEDYQPPGNEIEKVITKIWEDQLGVKPISIKDNFFELGGHSLIAANLITLIRNQFDVDIQLRDLFEQPTVKGLADVITMNQLESIDDEEFERLLAEVSSPEEV